MGSFTLVLTAITNAPKRPLIISCYYCQIAQFRVPVKHQVQNTPLFTPDNSKLLLHQKLEDFHYHYHSSEIENLPNYTPSAPSSTSAAVLSTTFFTRLGDIWLASELKKDRSLIRSGTRRSWGREHHRGGPQGPGISTKSTSTPGAAPTAPAALLEVHLDFQLFTRQ